MKLFRAYVDGQATSVHGTSQIQFAAGSRCFYGARPYRYPFVYWKSNFFTQPVGSVSWWEEVLALDEDTSGQ